VKPEPFPPTFEWVEWVDDAEPTDLVELALAVVVDPNAAFTEDV
jgi:hypothetical protein